MQPTSATARPASSEIGDDYRRHRSDRDQDRHLRASCRTHCDPVPAVVVGLAFLLLMLVFRSILVPLTATLGFLLTVLGHLRSDGRGVPGGRCSAWSRDSRLVSFMPIIVIGMVFGLAMDYQVFLVTRMREEYVHGASATGGRRRRVPPQRARRSPPPRLIMISVFAAFMLQDNPLIQSIGFALAAAVFFDAFVVRMALIPAVMYLLGDKAWWLPAWLDRLLPNVDVEGEKLVRRDAPDDASEIDEDLGSATAG